MTRTRLQGRGARHLIKLDREAGLDATYRSYISSGRDIDAGTNTVTYATPVDVKVRLKDLSISTLLHLVSIGMDQKDVIWFMRKSYVSDVKLGDILNVAGSDYVVQQLIRLDSLQLQWEFITRRRR